MLVSGFIFPKLTTGSNKMLNNLDQLGNHRQLIEALPDDREYAGQLKLGDISLFERWELPDNNGELTIPTSLIKPGFILWHTHNLDTMQPWLSDTDIQTAFITKCPVLLYHPLLDMWDYFDPCEYHPFPLNKPDVPTINDYQNLPYSAHRCDCYSFVKAVAHGLFGLEFPNLYLTDLNHKRLYTHFRNPAKLGFKSVRRIEPGNLIVGIGDAENPYHLGIVVDDLYVLHNYQHSSYLTNIKDFPGTAYKYVGLGEMQQGFL